ncbi:MAG: hypothetical protein IJH99_08075 [Eubacterium sp.]|nr:hypothetical protein [Eubacterium sp.]
MLKPNCFIDLLDTPMGRRNSYLCFANANEGGSQFGKNTLYLATCKSGGSGMVDLMRPNTCRQIKLELFKHGQKLPTVIDTTESEVILRSDAGSIRFCIAGTSLVYAKGTDGLALKLSTTATFFGTSVDLGGGQWKFNFGEGMARFLPFTGTVTPLPMGSFMAVPDEKGELFLGIEEHLLDMNKADLAGYPGYEEAVDTLQKEFDAFCDSLYPSLPAEFEPMRKQALFTTWSLMVGKDGVFVYQHNMVKMMRFVFESCFGWQQAMQAIWLSKDIRLAWDVLMSGFDIQDENGRIADAVSHKSGMGGSMKPPFQGVALKWLMENRDLSSIPVEDKKFVYDRMKKWLDFFYTFRDLDGDGIWENQSPLETGWEDAAYFYVGFPLASPDMNAYTVIMMDALAALGRTIGVPEEECAALSARADELTKKIIDMFWNGERWVAVNPTTGAKADSLSLPLFCALILGKRLPQDIIDKTVDFIFGGNGFATPFGFSSESVNSPYFHHGFTAGSVIIPAQLILCLALEACGREDLAKEMGLRYARTLRDNGMFHIINALDGSGERGLVAFGEKQLFWSAWASSGYLFFADRYGK